MGREPTGVFHVVLQQLTVAKSMQRLRDLKGLGPKTEAHLHAVGIETPEQLRQLGAIEAYCRLKASPEAAVQRVANLNFLYALHGAIENRSWLEVANHDKGQLLLALEERAELEAWFQDETFGEP